MHSFSKKPQLAQPIMSTRTSIPGRAHVGHAQDPDSLFDAQRGTGNPTPLRLLQSSAEESTAALTRTRAALPHFGWDLTAAPNRSHAADALQAKLAISKPGDAYEQEAERLADQVMRMPEPQLQRACRCDGGHTVPPEEEEMVQRGVASVGESVDSESALRRSEARVNAVSGGQLLTNEQRAFFEPRFGADFSGVRVHTDSSADTAARAVGADAYTRGGDIVFRAGQYRPHTYAGRHLLAHELTHVVQQGAAPRLQPVNEDGERQILPDESNMGVANHLVQRWPGDGMVPPGDCSWGSYIVLRGSVETAKAVVSSLGACSPGDSCLFLATKIAAITAEIAARVTLVATCFKGGDAGHRQQVQDKIAMMNRCYRFFDTSNCPPQLVAAMAVVVERAREVIAAAAVVVAVALVVALVAAIIALAEVIAALLAAAAEAAAMSAAAAALMALLVLLRDELSSAETPAM